MIIVLDFDDTLIATTPRLKPRLFFLTKSIGISDKKALRAYASTRNLFTLGKYTTKLEKIPVKQKFILEKLKKLFAKPRAYNYLGVEWFLKNLRKQEHYIILLTFGDYGYQMTKIKQSGLKRFFDEIIFTSTTKKEGALQKLKKKYGNSLIFLDDSSNALQVACKLNIPAIRVKKSIKNKPYYARILKQIGKMIK